jgi:hypothetical protein
LGSGDALEQHSLGVIDFVFFVTDFGQLATIFVQVGLVMRRSFLVYLQIPAILSSSPTGNSAKFEIARTPGLGLPFEDLRSPQNEVIEQD